MRLLADESIDGPIVARLRDDGHEVASVAEETPGVADLTILARAYQDGVVLLTADKDFGELVYRRKRPHAGVLLLRIAGLDDSSKSDLVSRAIADRGRDLPGAFSVLDAEALRIRRMTPP